MWDRPDSKLLFLFISQLRRPRSALQGAAGSLWSVLRVGRALLLAERAGGLLSLQQHRQGEDCLSEGPWTLCEGERVIPPLFVCLSFFHFFLQQDNIFILTTFPLRLFLFFLSNFLRNYVQCRTTYFTTAISISSVNHFEHICSGCRQSLATRDLIKSTLRHIYAALSSNIRIFLSLVKSVTFLQT